MPERTERLPTALPRRSGSLRRRLHSRRVVVVEESMVPTLRPGDRILVEPAREVSVSELRGELVVFENPEEEGRYLVKRVAGIPGDQLRIGPTVVLEDPVLPGPPGAASRPMTSDAENELVVPPEHLFVVSDAPERGRDSRQFGPISVDLLVGRVWWRYAPSARRGPLP